MNKILTFLLNTIATGFILLFLARLLFPATMEELIIRPARNVPFVGRVLGESWNAADSLNRTLTQNTNNLSDQIESSGTNLDSSLSSISESSNPGQTIKSAIENSVNTKIEALKDLPAETIEKIKNEARDEIYEQVCKSYIEEKEQNQE